MSSRFDRLAKEAANIKHQTKQESAQFTSDIEVHNRELKKAIWNPNGTPIGHYFNQENCDLMVDFITVLNTHDLWPDGKLKHVTEKDDFFGFRKIARVNWEGKGVPIGGLKDKIQAKYREQSRIDSIVYLCSDAKLRTELHPFWPSFYGGQSKRSGNKQPSGFMCIPKSPLIDFFVGTVSVVSGFESSDTYHVDSDDLETVLEKLILPAS